MSKAHDLQIAINLLEQAKDLIYHTLGDSDIALDASVRISELMEDLEVDVAELLSEESNG